MKHYKIMSTVTIVAVIAIFSCCSKNDLRPAKETTAIVMSAKADKQNTDGSRLRNANSYNLKQVEHFMDVARTLGRNAKDVVSFDLVYDGKTKNFQMRNIKVPYKNFIPFGHTPGTEKYTVSCAGGSAGGTTTECSGKVCVGTAVKDCLDSGGCATVCASKTIHIIYIPDNLL